MTLINQDNIPTNVSLDADLCVIGGGVTGLSIALEYARQHPAKKVIVLESGFEEPGPAQEAAGGIITGNDVYALQATRFRAYGGTQWVWGGNSRLFDPIDFEKRDWVSESGWPISYEDYAKYIKKGTELMSIDDLDWSNEHPKLIHHKLIDSEIFEHCHFKLSPQIMSPHEVDKGHYGLAHAEAIEAQENLHIYLDQTVIKLGFNAEKNRIRQVTTRTLDNRQNTIQADAFVLAAGALENGRLMKYWFAQEDAPTLPCNDALGRYFMEHPHRDIAYTYIAKRQVKKYRHYIGTRIGTAVHMSRFRVTDDAQRKHRLNNHTIVMQRQTEKYDPHVPFGQAFKAIVLSEQEPLASNRVELQTEKDIFGIPKLDLHWGMSDHDYDSMNFIAEAFPQFTGVNDLGRSRAILYKKGAKILGGHHHMGTTRMGDSPKNAVVDKNCKVFGMDNLFMAGGSVFSTSGSVNPTLNMVILGQRLVDHLSGEMA